MSLMEWVEVERWVYPNLVQIAFKSNSWNELMRIIEEYLFLPYCAIKIWFTKPRSMNKDEFYEIFNKIDLDVSEISWDDGEEGVLIQVGAGCSIDYVKNELNKVKSFIECKV